MTTENQVSNSEAAVETTTPKKKVAKKKAAKKTSAPKKKAAKKSTPKKVVVEKEELKAKSLIDALKAISKSDQKLGVVSVNGKKYSFTKRSTWAISKNLIKNGKDGLIMVVEEEGHYIYPSSAYKELFGKIFKSGTWEKIGIYSQSTLPQWHSDYFTAKK